MGHHDAAGVSIDLLSFASAHESFSLVGMKDLTSPFLIKLKGVLFLLVGIAAGTLLLIEHLELKMAVLLAICVWCFCRSYYFAFYVIEHYVDPGYRFSGLWSFAKYMVKKRRQ